MRPRKEAILALQSVLGRDEANLIYRLSFSQSQLEARWRRKLADYWTATTGKIISSLRNDGAIDESHIRFDLFLFEQAYAVQRQAIMDADKQRMPAVQRGDTRRMAQIPVGRFPRKLDELREWYDFFRKKDRVPPRQRVLGERLKKSYLEKVQSVWQKYSRDFREGTSFDKKEIVSKIQRAASTEFARAKMTADTESTRYYNAGRRAIYDQSDDVTHYLFVAIRDHATTKWCKTRTGLVYAKGDPLLDKETPPCHWNCRSEILPLSALNPRHAALIEDRSKARRNNQCTPLPKGWNRR